MIELTLSCGEIDAKYAEFAVGTTHNTIKEAIESAEKEDFVEQLRIFSNITAEVTRYSKIELQHHWFNKTSQFQDWCDDVGLYYVYRLVLFKKPIPVSLAT